MAQAAVAAQVHQTLDGDAHFTAQVALDHVLADFGAQALDFRLGQVADLGGGRHAGGLAHLLRPGAADAIDALQAHPDVLLGRQVDACNTRHDAISKLGGRTRPGHARQDCFESELRILAMSRITWKPMARRPWTRHGECAHAPASDVAGGPGCPVPPAALLQRGTASSHPCARRRTGRPFQNGSGPLDRMPAEWVRRTWERLVQPQPRANPPPREPPLRLAFFSKLSYWCDIRWAWIWAMKSITTTTTISSEVPPK